MKLMGGEEAKGASLLIRCMISPGSTGFCQFGKLLEGMLKSWTCGEEEPHC